MSTEPSAREGRSAREGQVWESLRSLILDRYDYRRQVAETLGMSFFRTKVLRLLVDGPVTMRELAKALSTDAPYMSLLVDDLEARQMVERSVYPGDRRVKLVTITTAGRVAAQQVMEILLTPPPPMHALSDDDFASLERIVELLAGEGTESITAGRRHDEA